MALADDVTETVAEQVDEERWRAYLGSDSLDAPAELVFYCTACADREFGDVR